MGKNNHFNKPFGSGNNELPVEAIRYRLIVSDSSPVAQTQLIALKLLGLDQVITIGKVSSAESEVGFDFSLDKGGIDPILKVLNLKELYLNTDEGYEGSISLPAVVDLRNSKIVNDDEEKLSIYWETAWEKFHKNGAPDLYAEGLRKEIDELNTKIHELFINIEVAGHAVEQKEYEESYDEIFESIEELEKRLGEHRYLLGSKITDSDIRLFPLLVRFDSVYNMIYRINRNRLVEFSNLWNYAKDLYQIQAFSETTNFEAIRNGFYLNKNNPYGIVAKGPDENIWNEPHDRDRFSNAGGVV